jgi:hypothetical protein
MTEGGDAAVTARIKAAGGWIDVAWDGAIVTMAAVGPPLRFLVTEGATLPARQKRTEERGRYRRMAIAALCATDAGLRDALEDAGLVWSHRAG